MRKKVVRGTLPRYVQARTLADGDIHYRFNPPQSLIDSGVVSRTELGVDLRRVRHIAKELNDKIDEHRNKQEQLRGLKSNHNLNRLVQVYTESYDFEKLKDKTKKDYLYFLSIIQSSFGNVNYKNVTSQMVKEEYEQWLKRGISFANHVATMGVQLYNFAIYREYCTFNPFVTIKKQTPKQRKTIWTEKDVQTFLDVAYSDFSTRNVGLIIHMAYEWCQRLGDMRLLTWDSIDFETQRLNLQQSKRGAIIQLPINDDLIEMLTQQKNEFGFQQYVSPQTKPTGGVYEPYSLYLLSKKGRVIMRQAGLSEELRLMDLRRTGITQIAETGVSLAAIMSVSGHQSVASLKPYVRHTYEAAKTALTNRANRVKSISTADKESDIYND